MLIYQADNGSDNTNQIPKGGVVAPNTLASSMVTIIANPITYYGGIPWTIINQAGHSGDLYNYYWTSYSRGTDGRYNPNEPSWHNVYLDGYIPLRAKSIYDPCPYLYRIPSNGIWNQFTNSGWTMNSYLGGVSWNLNTLGESWLLSSGRREVGSSVFAETGRTGYYYSSTADAQTTGYALLFNADKLIHSSLTNVRSRGQSVRCIEDRQRGLIKAL